MGCALQGQGVSQTAEMLFVTVQTKDAVTQDPKDGCHCARATLCKRWWQLPTPCWEKHKTEGLLSLPSDAWLMLWHRSGPFILMAFRGSENSALSLWPRVEEQYCCIIGCQIKCCGILNSDQLLCNQIQPKVAMYHVVGRPRTVMVRFHHYHLPYAAAWLFSIRFSSAVLFLVGLWGADCKEHNDCIFSKRCEQCST